MAQAADALVADQDMADASDSPTRRAASNEVEIFASIEERFYLDQLVASSLPVTRQVTPINEVVGDRSEGDREVSWSSSSSAHWYPPPPPLLDPAQSGTAGNARSPVQPFGDYFIVVCRLSSEKKAPDPSGKKTTRERVQENNLRREEEGMILATHLASNCPTPVEFEEVWSYCGIRHSSHTTDWAKPA
jgi:hypothetical protein